MTRTASILLALCLLLPLHLSPARATEAVPALDPQPAPELPELSVLSVLPAMDAALAARLAADGPLKIDGKRLDQSALRALYARRGFAPAWFVPTEGGDPDGMRLAPAAESLRTVLGAADAEGLAAIDYHPGAIERRLGATDPATRVELDLLLSDALMAYAVDLRTGRVPPKSISREMYITPVKLDRAEVALAALAAPDLRAFLAGLTPPHPDYAGLRTALARYRAVERAGGWPTVSMTGSKLKSGAKDPAVRALRRRLIATGDLDARTKETDLYDPAVHKAVTRFQVRHGLDADGALGEATRQALSLPVPDRIGQIIASMERLRWLPDDLGARHVVVNIPGFSLKAVDRGTVVHDMRVIVGTTVRRTPVFTSEIVSLVLNPTWTVPLMLAREDILPKLKKDRSYLASHGIQVLSGWSSDAKVVNPGAIDWNAVGGGINRLRLRQAPGPQNALGRVKFNIPNPFGVYLHDTPHREKFGKTVRTFSSGCVRVGDPLALAAFLLGDMPEWGPERRQQVLDGGQTRTVVLREPVSVHLLYQTAWLDGQGVVHFRDDIYGRDQQLLQAIGRTGEPVRPMAAVALR